MRNFYRILRKGVFTEKATTLTDSFNKYTFLVSKDANKIEIRQSIERLFGLKNKVLSVNTSVCAGKWRRRGGTARTSRGPWSPWPRGPRSRITARVDPPRAGAP